MLHLGRLWLEPLLPVCRRVNFNDWLIESISASRAVPVRFEKWAGRATGQPKLVEARIWSKDREFIDSETSTHSSIFRFSLVRCLELPILMERTPTNQEGGALTRCVYAYVAKDPFWVNLALKFQTVSVALKCFNGARTRSTRSLNSPSLSAQALKSSERPKRGGENCKFRSFNCPKTLVESNYFKLCHLFNVWCKGCDLVHRELVQQISRWGNLTLRSDSRRQGCT